MALTDTNMAVEPTKKAHEEHPSAMETIKNDLMRSKTARSSVTGPWRLKRWVTPSLQEVFMEWRMTSIHMHISFTTIWWIGDMKFLRKKC